MLYRCAKNMPQLSFPTSLGHRSVGNCQCDSATRCGSGFQPITTFRTWLTQVTMKELGYGSQGVTFSTWHRTQRLQAPYLTFNRSMIKSLNSALLRHITITPSYAVDQLYLKKEPPDWDQQVGCITVRWTFTELSNHLKSRKNTHHYCFLSLLLFLQGST